MSIKETITHTAKKVSASAKKRMTRTVYGFVSPGVCVLLLCALAVLCLRIDHSYTRDIDRDRAQTKQDNAYFSFLRQEQDRLAAESEALAKAPKELGDGVFGENVIMVACSENRVICHKDPAERIFPASMTKLMTALVAIERLDDPAAVTYEVTEEIVQYCRDQNASRAGFLAGEHATALDLLYCCILPSGGDATLALAQGVAGTEAEMVRLMNQKARELGLKDTQFANVVGLHDENHYTTLEDLVTIIQYGLQNETFRTLLTTTRYNVPPTDKHTKGFTVRSTITQAMSNYDMECEYILGGKTGFTPQAGQCLAAYARCEGEFYIIITANTGPTSYNANHVQDVDSLLEQFVVNAE